MKSQNLGERGTAVRLGYRPADAQADERAQTLTPAKLWDHLERLLNALLPVAEKCGVALAMRRLFAFGYIRGLMHATA